MFENPPPVKLRATSGPIPHVDPTEVTKGQSAGKIGVKVLLAHCAGSSSPPRTPESPAAKMTEIPRDPRAIYPLHVALCEDIHYECSDAEIARDRLPSKIGIEKVFRLIIRRSHDRRWVSGLM